MHSSVRALLRSCVLGFALAGLAAGASAQQKFVNILTGGQSGVYYPLGVALGQIYAKSMPDTKSSVQATKASVENLNLLQAGRGEIAFTLATPSLTPGRASRTQASRRRSTSSAPSVASIRTTSRSSPAPIRASRRSKT
jgi:TRAP transporter TAXI family solute receptor